jgi:hypothetical protein
MQILEGEGIRGENGKSGGLEVLEGLAGCTLI